MAMKLRGGLHDSPGSQRIGYIGNRKQTQKINPELERQGLGVPESKPVGRVSVKSERERHFFLRGDSLKVIPISKPDTVPEPTSVSLKKVLNLTYGSKTVSKLKDYIDQVLVTPHEEIEIKEKILKKTM